MKSHVTVNLKACFAALRQTSSVRSCLLRHALLTLVRALVVRKVNYSKYKLAGISGRLMNRLQSILNAIARLVLCEEVKAITPLFRELHWLRVSKRFQFRLCVLVFTAFIAQHRNSSLRAFIGSHKSLLAADTLSLLVPFTPRANLGHRPSAVAARGAWNTLPTFAHSPDAHLHTYRHRNNWSNEPPGKRAHHRNWQANHENHR